MFGRFFKNNAPKLYEKALDLLDDDELDAALKIAKKLHKARYSGAFEIEALVQRAQGNLERAATILEEGVKSAPQSWLNQHLLGLTYSDLGRYPQALSALDQALAAPYAEKDLVGLNRSLVYFRANQPLEALAACPQSADSEPLQSQIAVHRMVLLTSLERYEEAVTLGKTLLGNQSEMISAVHFQLAEAFWKGTRNRDLALEHAIQSLKTDNTAFEGQKLVEEICPPERLTLRRYRFWFEADFNPKKAIPGMGDRKLEHIIVLCQVVAANAGEAETVYRNSELPELSATLQLKKSEDAGPFPFEHARIFSGPARIMS